MQHRPLSLRSLFIVAAMVSLLFAQSPTPAYQTLPRSDPNSQLAHEQLIEKARHGKIDVYFVGDSITRRWGATDYPDFLANWKLNFFGWNAANFGWGGDTIQNILWRLENGELDNVNPKIIVILAGTNNVGREPGDDAKVADITKGIKALVDLCRKKAPHATIVLTAIFPRNDSIAVIPTINRVNDNIARFADGKRVRFLNINDKLADKDGALFEGVTVDKLHLSLKGYQIWADELKPIFTEILGPPATTDQAPPPTGDPSAVRKSDSALSSSRAQTQTTLKETFKNAFMIGAALNHRHIFEEDARITALIVSQFNTITPENLLKWGLVHPAPDKYDFAVPDRYVAFGEKYQMFIVGHTLVWHKQTPAWVFQDEAGNPTDRDTLLKRLREHIMTVVGRYKGRIKGWDVVNEALNRDGTMRQSPWMKIIGEDYLAKAFEFAHQADPNAQLYYNDYDLELPAKRKGAVELIKKLKAAGVPITAIGLQNHNRMDWPTVADEDATISAFEGLGIKVNITELDVDALPRTTEPGADYAVDVAPTPQLNPYTNGMPDPAQQALAKRYADLFRVYLKHRAAIDRVTFWCVTDGDSWLNNWPIKGRTNYPLLFDRAGQPKPAFDAVIKTAKALSSLPPPVTMTAEQDHQRMMDLLHIASLRPGANGSNPKAPNAANYDEAKANPYPNLPDPLVLKNGKKVTNAKTWWQQRRPEIVEDFDREIYGRVPNTTPKVRWEVTDTTNETKYDVPVITKKIVGHVDNSAYPFITVDIQLTLTTPANATGPVPVIMELSFVFPPGFRPPAPPANGPPPGPSWQQQVLAKGWGYASLIPTTIQPDNGAGLTQGIIGFCNQGQPRKLDDWGALRAWAWGASRALDYFETDKSVDAKQVGLEGHSRYGKAVLVAMAYDQRFAIAYVSSSGEGGAKIHRRNWGELVENVAGTGEYHWMAGNFLRYAGPLNWNDLPVDSHELIALCAPRPVFIGAGANGDGWVDAKGMFKAAAAAGPVYKLLGKRDLGTTEFPPTETPLTNGDVAFRQHSGGHTPGPNWPTFLTFASRYFSRAKP
jgi:GH35 family endo-1,4-beta-xylanase/lysophospholipase L1-like esterase